MRIEVAVALQSVAGHRHGVHLEDAVTVVGPIATLKSIIETVSSSAVEF